MSSSEHERFQRAAERIARTCRAPILEGLSSARVSIKPDRTVVTEVDLAVQRQVFDSLASEFPDHALVGEEDESAARLSTRLPGYAWVVDPIDGTRNYAVGFPCFATSIALLEDGSPVVGVVAEHVSGQLFSARLGGGVTLDGRPVRVSEGEGFRKKLIGIPTSMDVVTQRVVAGWFRRDNLILRNTGSAAYHLALVASGALNAAYGYQCKIWDIAAGALLVFEAGGRMTALDGAALFPWHPGDAPDRNLPSLAAAPRLHETLIQDFRD